jgi:hypothetical protein
MTELLVPADAHSNLPGITLTPPNNSRGEFPNVYHTPYPFLPAQIGRQGRIIRPSFLPTLSPYFESTEVAPPVVPFNRAPSPHLRSGEHPHPSGYYPPKGQDPAASSPPPPTEVPSSSSSLSSQMRFGSCSDRDF